MLARLKQAYRWRRLGCARVCSGDNAEQVRGQAVVRQLRAYRRGSILSPSLLQHLLLSVVLRVRPAAVSEPHTTSRTDEHYLSVCRRIYAVLIDFMLTGARATIERVLAGDAFCVYRY